MLDPTPGLFYSIAKEVFQEKAIFATRSISKISIVPGDSKFCQTLCVGKDGIIFVNKEFWKKNIKTRADAATVFIHELFHVVTGDTNKTSIAPEDREIANIAMDMRINSVVCKIITESYGHIQAITPSFLTKFYKPYGITGLLRPLSSYPKNSKYRMLYNSLYDDSTPQNEEYIKEIFKNEEAIREALRMLLPKDIKEKIKGIVFLGNHNPEVEREMEETGDIEEHDEVGEEKEKEERYEDTLLQDADIPEDLKDEINDALAEKLAEMPVAGYSSLITTSIVKILVSKKSISKRILEQFACNHKVNELKSFFVKERRTTNIVPIRPSSRDIAMLACGVVPIFWKNISLFKGKNNKNVAIYLDVSGSVTSYLPKLLGIIKNLHTDISKVYCFSNFISEHTIQELNQGQYKTTGGTDFDCIGKHILENKCINKAIIFTDGYADLYKVDKKELLLQLKDAAIVYFGDSVNKKNFFQSTFNKGFDLEEILK